MSTSLCSICSSLNLQRPDFERPPFEPEGRYQSLVSKNSLGFLRTNANSCSLCHLILYALQKNEASDLVTENDDTEWEMIWSQNNQEYEPETDEAEESFGSGLFPRLKKEGSDTAYDIQLIDDVSPEGFLRGREIPDTIDAGTIKGWMERCRVMHGDQCIPSYLQVSRHPAETMEFLVIDVNKQCLVNISPDAKYVALSYVWGQANHLTTVKSVLSKFRTEGAFSRKKPPRTISDAIDLTRVIGFQYLWVDALCIVQDEGEIKGALIANMDAVYGHAAVTIVAASGLDADSGLEGWKTSSPQRAICMRSIGSNFKLGVLPFLDLELMNSPHAKRGWTYQEGVLSPRCLIFLNSKLYFHCRTSIWREDIHAEEITDIKPIDGANTLGRTSSEWPLRRYSQAVDAYTTRNLTYQSDILNAFSGIAKAMVGSMGGTRMWFAVPAVVFDWGILWMGNEREKNRGVVRWEAFPSWSWVGWRGGVICAGDVWSGFDHGWLLTRTWIEWYTVVESGEVVLIWDPERDGTTVSTLEIDDSISSSESEEEEEEEEEKEGEDEGEDPCPTYGHPAPNNPYGRNIHSKLLSILPERPPPTQFQPSSKSNLLPGTLVFSTIIATFSMDFTGSQTKTGSSIFKLYDSSNRICGFIRDCTKTTCSDPSNIQQEGEIILLSQASPATLSMMSAEQVDFAGEYRVVASREEALERDEHVDEEEILGVWHNWDWFNAMLVGRVENEVSGNQDGDGDVYEREGIGFVHKRALEYALEPEPAWRVIYLR